MSEGKTASFDIADLDASDEGCMTVISNGQVTNWVWVFAGPGHQRSIAQANRLSRDRLNLEREQDEARVNGRKWKAPDEAPDAMIQRNVTMVLERLIGWHLVDEDGAKTEEVITMGGEPFLFSTENARKVLTDRRKLSLLIQALEFLGDNAAFTRRSASA